MSSQYYNEHSYIINVYNPNPWILVTRKIKRINKQKYKKIKKEILKKNKKEFVKITEL